MKKILFFISSTLLLNVYAIGNPPLTGTFSIPGDYATISAAISDLNNYGVGSGGAIFNVSSGYSEILTTAGLSLSIATTIDNNHFIVFQKAGQGPNPIVIASGTYGSSSDAAITILGTSFVTFDGIDIGVSGSNVEFGYYIRNASAILGSQNNTIKNCQITLDNTNNNSCGIYQYSTATSATGANSYNLFHKITIDNCFNGMYILSVASIPDLNIIVDSCKIGTHANSIGVGNSPSGATWGLRVDYTSGTNVFGCDVGNITMSGTKNIGGIYLSSCTGLSQLYNNKVHDIKVTSTSTSSSPIGIRVDEPAGCTASVFNNMLWNFSHGITSATATMLCRAISANYNGTAGTVNVYYNTAVLNMSNKPTCTVFHVGGGLANVKDNIFYNTSPGGSTSSRYCYYVTSGTLNTSDYNDLYISSGTNNYTGYYGSSKALLSDWRTATSMDANSISLAVNFVSSTSDLHVVATTNCTFDGKGTVISGITKDFDNETRDISTPDIGADEFTSICTNPTIYSVTGGGSFCSGGSGVVVGLSSSQIGAKYQLYRGGTIAVGSPVAGTGTSISFGNQNIADTYTVKTTADGCYCITAMTGNAVITIISMPSTPEAGNNGPVCVGSALSLLSTTLTDATYAWTGPNGFTSNAQNPQVSNSAMPAMAGIYSVIATVNGCASLAAATTVAINNLPSAPVANNNGPVCEGSALSLTASTVLGATYSWTGPFGFTSSAQNPTVSNNATTDMAGNYYVTAIVNGCISPQGSTNVFVNAFSTAPTGIAGTTSICSGTSTTLTAIGGIEGSGSTTNWFSGSCESTFTQEWFAQPYATLSTTVNSSNGGILDVTSTNIAPEIDMYSIGSFDPALYKYIQIRYKVVSGGPAGNISIYYTNTLHTSPDPSQVVSGVINNDGNWHIMNIDMSTSPLWLNSNVTGWRFDWCSAWGANLQIDYISLGAGMAIEQGNSVTVSPSIETNYYVSRRGMCNTTACANTTLTISPEVSTPVFNMGSTSTRCSGAGTVTYTATATATTGIAYTLDAESLLAGNTIDAATGAVTYTAAWYGTSIITATAAGCSGPTIATHTVTIKESPSAVTVTPSTQAMCSTDIQPLVASGGTMSGQLTTILDENFNGTTNSWTTINNSFNAIPANAAWFLEPDGYSYNGTWHSNDNSQFYVSNSDYQGGGTTATILQSPAFSTVGYTTASMSFYQYFSSGWVLTATVDYSLDGSNWINLKTYTNDIGAPNGFVQDNASLPAGQPTVYLRFKLDGDYGYYWGIDNVKVSGNTPNTPITWTPIAGLYSNSGATTSYIVNTPTYNVYAHPTVSTIYTATATAINGCTTSGTAALTVTTLPVATFSYAGTPYCSNTSDPLPSLDGAAGIFTAPSGLSINATSGLVSLSGSTAGTYTVTNTIAAFGGCGAVQATTNLTITALPVATFSYASSSYVTTDPDPSPSYSGGGVAGTFSEITGGIVFVSAATGLIDLSASALNTYTVTNTIAATGGCAVVTATATITINPPPTKTLSLKAFIEGLYIGGGMMREALDFNPVTEDFPMKWGAGIADTVTVALYDTTYSNLIALYHGVYLNTDGSISIPLSSLMTGSYYITIFARNSVPITTATPQSFAGPWIYYDFTYPIDQAYGAGLSPQKDLGDGFFGMYTGELDHDAYFAIDGSDVTILDPDVILGPYGYLDTDLNGDGVVDGSDMAIMDANSIFGPLFWNPTIAKKKVNMLNQHK